MSITQHQRNVMRELHQLLSIEVSINQLATIINRLTPDQLILLFDTLRPLPVKDFAELYGINRGNLSRFLTGKKTSQAAIRAIKDFLLNGLAESTSVIMVDQSRVATPKPRDILNHIQLKLSNRLIDSLILVNADQTIYHSDQFIYLADHIKLHVIGFQSNNQNRLQTLIGRPWFTLVQTLTNTKSAVDEDFTWFTSNLTIDLVKYPNIELIILNQRQFVEELILMIRGFINNPIYALLPKYAYIGYWLLEHYVDRNMMDEYLLGIHHRLREIQNQLITTNLDEYLGTGSAMLKEFNLPIGTTKDLLMGVYTE